MQDKVKLEQNLVTFLLFFMFVLATDIFSFNKDYQNQLTSQIVNCDFDLFIYSPIKQYGMSKLSVLFTVVTKTWY